MRTFPRRHATYLAMVRFPYQGRASILIALLFGPACANALAADNVGQPATRPIRDWSSMFARADGWTGGDGAATVPLPGGRTMWLFGDSWIGPVREGKHATGSTMVNNAIAVQAIREGDAAPAPEDVTFFWGPGNAQVRETMCTPSSGPLTQTF